MPWIEMKAKYIKISASLANDILNALEKVEQIKSDKSDISTQNTKRKARIIYKTLKNKTL